MPWPKYSTEIISAESAATTSIHKWGKSKGQLDTPNNTEALTEAYGAALMHTALESSGSARQFFSKQDGHQKLKRGKKNKIILVSPDSYNFNFLKQPKKPTS